MTKDEALRLALEALEAALSDDQLYIDKSKEAITAIKAALEAPQRTWVGLTEAECGVLWKVDMTPFDYYQAIEAKLKEKNT
jgi:hypothetical protein